MQIFAEFFSSRILGRWRRANTKKSSLISEDKGQDKFDHDKGQKSAISGRRLHWRLSTGFFAFFPVFVCNLDEPPKIWRK